MEVTQSTIDDETLFDFCFIIYFVGAHCHSASHYCIGERRQMRLAPAILAALAAAPQTAHAYSSSGGSQHSPSRRAYMRAFAAVLGSSIGAQAAGAAVETIGKEEGCYDATCLGVWDGLLADCPHGGLGGMGGSGCVSSQDDTPGSFAEPWDYSEAPMSSLNYEDQMRMLRPAIELVCAKRGDKVDVVLEKDRYLRVLFKDGKTSEKSIGEFYFTPDDTTVQFRLASSADSSLTSYRNMERAEMIRKQLRYTKIPVLRNRKRSLFFVESGTFSKLSTWPAEPLSLFVA